MHPAYLLRLHELLAFDAEEATGHEALAPSGAAAGMGGLFPYHLLRRLVLDALKRSGRPWLGLELGARLELPGHGPLALAAMSAALPREALQLLADYAELRLRALTLTVCEQDEGLALVFTPVFEEGPVARFLIETCLVVCHSLLTAMAGRHSSEVIHTLPWPEPPWVAQYLRLLGGRLRFDAAQAALILPPALAMRPNWGHDPVAHALARRECERRRLAASAHGAIASQVRLNLDSAEGPPPSAAKMASALGISMRSLHRKLAAAGSSFQQLLDDSRRERACWMLRHTRLPVERIAERLGFPSGSNFSRSFRRWCHTTPRTYRQEPG